jgi:D-tagatose-1,6-bisphosphate aldolase subunit GatZ/KbaZ
MRDPIEELRSARSHGEKRGLCSVCSAHPMVLEAAVNRVARTGLPLLVEATANQVNQHGGYTGMRPEEFAVNLADLCASCDADPALLVFGGDHLGPWPWRSRSAREAMVEAEVLVRSFVAAGARKIHIDASMPLGGDGPALAPEIAVTRAALLCRTAEEAWERARASRPRAPAPIYVVGTEVPVPGGTSVIESEGGPAPTSADAFRSVVELHRETFARQGLGPVWDRVIAVVVQPGVEFSATHVRPYRRARSADLSRALRDYPGLFFEGHSTDYQSDEALRELVEDGVAFLKVGPALTFALREALFGLCLAARELTGGKPPEDLIDTVLRVMQRDQRHWKGYYPEDESLPFLLAYGYSDRIRYYWFEAEVAGAVERLFATLRARAIPPQLLSQHLPRLCGVQELGRLGSDPRALTMAAVDAELARYERACWQERG